MPALKVKPEKVDYDRVIFEAAGFNYTILVETPHGFEDKEANPLLKNVPTNGLEVKFGGKRHFNPNAHPLLKNDKKMRDSVIDYLMNSPRYGIKFWIYDHKEELVPPMTIREQEAMIKEQAERLAMEMLDDKKK